MRQGRARASHGDALTAEQTNFYDCFKFIYGAVIAFTNRLSDMAASLAGAGYAAVDARLLSIASSLKNVLENSPADFHEFQQSTFIMHQMIELEGEWVRSKGGFDRNFYPYYKTDLHTGRLIKENAQELIEFYFTRSYSVKTSILKAQGSVRCKKSTKNKPCTQGVSSYP